MKQATLHEGAEADLREALDYYETQRAGLGGEFRREFEATLERICNNPLAYAIEDNAGVRYGPLHRFPYYLAYVDMDDRLWVVAVAHYRQRPRYWASRRPN